MDPLFFASPPAEHVSRKGPHRFFSDLEIFQTRTPSIKKKYSQNHKNPRRHWGFFVQCRGVIWWIGICRYMQEQGIRAWLKITRPTPKIHLPFSPKVWPKYCSSHQKVQNENCHPSNFHLAFCMHTLAVFGGDERRISDERGWIFPPRISRKWIERTGQLRCSISGKACDVPNECWWFLVTWDTQVRAKLQPQICIFKPALSRVLKDIKCSALLSYRLVRVSQLQL